MGKQIVLLQALAATPATLARLVAGQEDGAAARALAVTVVQMVGVERSTLRQLQRVATEEEPLLAPVVAQAATGEVKTAAQTVETFQEVRQQTIAYLKELSAGAWQRRAIHPTAGRVTLRALVQRLVAHDATQLQALRGSRAWAQSHASERPAR